MAKRKGYIFLSLISLAIGLGVYVVFKGNSYLHLAAEQMLGASFGLHSSCAFVNNYLCDFLWSFSLTCGLVFILGDSLARKVICGVIATAYGAIWELLQFTCVVPGTGDVRDVFIYFLAGLVAVLIIQKKGE